MLCQTCHCLLGVSGCRLRSMPTLFLTTSHACEAATHCLHLPYKSLLEGPNNALAAASVSSLLVLPAFSSLMATRNWLNCSYDSRALRKCKTHRAFRKHPLARSHSHSQRQYIAMPAQPWANNRTHTLRSATHWQLHSLQSATPAAV